MSKKLKKDNQTDTLDKDIKKKQRQNRNIIIFTIVLAAAIVLGTLGILMYRGGFIQNNMSAITIEGEKYKLSEFNYYYYAYYNAYIDENSQYMSYMFDESESLKTQEYDESQSWFDFFSDGAKDSMISVIEAAKEAKEQGYELSENAKEEIQDTITSIEESAKTAGISADKYLENIYGKGMTKDLYRKHQEYSYLASEYGDYLKAGYTFSEDEIEDYYHENFQKYTYVAYERFYVKASDVDTEPTKAQKSEAYDVAEQMLERVQKGEDLKTVSEDFEDKGTYYSFDDAYYDASFSYGDWLFSEDRKDGDSNVIDDGSGYYVMVFHSRNEGDYKTADIIDLCFAVDETAYDTSQEEEQEKLNQAYEDSCGKAEAVLKQWETGEKTQKSFEEVVSEYEAESDSDGTFTNLTRNTLDSSLDKWIFDESRQSGDTSVIYTNGGFHVIYYMQPGEEAWKAESENDLREDIYNQWYQGLTDNAAVSESKYVLGFAGGESE